MPIGDVENEGDAASGRGQRHRGDEQHGEQEAWRVH